MQTSHDVRRRRSCSCLLLLALLVCVGCAGGVGIRRIDDAEWFERENRSALDSNLPSERTRQFLRRETLAERYGTRPDEVLEELNRRLIEEGRREIAFHLAELAFREANFTHPSSPRARKLYLSGAEYAWSFLFDDKLVPEVNEFDMTFRWACDFYNRSLAGLISLGVEEGRKREGGKKAVLSSLAGETALQVDDRGMQFSIDEFDEFVVAYDYDVYGISGGTREFGIGVPCIGFRDGTVVGSGERSSRFLPDVRQSFAETVFLRFDGSIRDRVGQRSPRRATVVLFDPLQTSRVDIGGRSVPLEVDLTIPLAYQLKELGGYSGLQAMIKVEKFQEGTGLYMLQPYDPDRIPVVFVHGLMSSPLTWVELFNDLLADHELRARYQFWFFRYPTGNPIAYSASLLRDALVEIQTTFDPDGTNPAFCQMVLCGHSMGGLLSRMMVQSSGNRLWENLSSRPFDDVGFEGEEEEMLRSALFFERLPFITRVVFMATPHRGSPLAEGLIGWLGRSLTRVSTRMLDTADAMRSRLLDTDVERLGNRLDWNGITGVGGLSPSSMLLQELSSWEFDPDVALHSIIGNRSAADRPGGTDGTVRYESSHLEGVLSEKIVKSEHSVQNVPATLIELRRILHLHLDEIERTAMTP